MKEVVRHLNHRTVVQLLKHLLGCPTEFVSTTVYDKIKVVIKADREKVQGEIYDWLLARQNKKRVQRMERNIKMYGR